jgi:GAF domain-containing protein
MQALEKLLAMSDVNTALRLLMSACCHLLECDRCFLYLRDPATGQGRITHCHVHSPKYPDLTGMSSTEPEDVANLDPLMALALRSPEAVFVSDIETAGTEVLNLAYEQEVYAHRALVHAPLYWQDQLYGILEPCVFATPREWSSSNQELIIWLQERLPLVVAKYLQQFPL